MKNKAFFTQVIGGKYKGLKLELPPLEHTRSTKSIMKESLFNTLSEDINEKIFIELFAGSGSVMIEAISRGAKKSYAIELDKKAFCVLSNNIKKMDEKSFNIYHGDTFKLSPIILDEITHECIIYVDPPFFYRQDMQDIYEKCFQMLKNINDTHIYMIIFEHVTSYNMPQIIGKFKLFKSKKFGKSTLSYFSKAT